MTYRDAMAELVTKHHLQIESDLDEARIIRDHAEAAFVDADGEVARLEAILVMSTAAAAPRTVASERTTLHEAMRKVLQSAPGRRMPASDLAKAIDSRGLYKMRDGRPVEAQQIHARVGHYGHMFERDGQGIGLV